MLLAIGGNEARNTCSSQTAMHHGVRVRTIH